MRKCTIYSWTIVHISLKIIGSTYTEVLKINTAVLNLFLLIVSYIIVGK